MKWIDNPSYWISEEEYALVTSKTPIPTVDLVILRKGQIGWEALILVRKTGYEKGKWCIIGGRQWKWEAARDTITRQAKELRIKVEVIPPFEPNFPAWVDDNPNQDKTKHSCTNVYPVEIISGTIKPAGEEYSGFKWVPVDNLPEMAYDHRFEVLKAVEQLKRFGGRLKNEKNK